MRAARTYAVLDMTSSTSRRFTFAVLALLAVSASTEDSNADGNSSDQIDHSAAFSGASSISVLAPDPAYSSTPPPGSTISLLTVFEGGIDPTFNIDVTNNGDPGSALNGFCGVKLGSDPQFSVSNGAFFLSDTAPPHPVAIICDASIAGTFIGTVDCSHNGINIPSPASYDFICQVDPTFEVDLSMTKMASVATAIEGDSFNYTLVVSNAGPTDAFDARVVDNLPSELVDVSWVCDPGSSGTCPGSGIGDIDDLVDIPAGSSVSFSITVEVDLGALSSITNIANVVADVGDVDTNTGNNSGSATIEVLSPDSFDLQTTKGDGLATAHSGEEISYTIRVSNAGSTLITGAMINDSLPEPLLNATWTCTPSAGSACSVSGTGDIADLVTLQPAGTLVYTLTATIDKSYTGNLQNTAIVAMPNGITDENPSNNSATDLTDVVASADLVVNKTVATSYAFTGKPLEFQVTITNLGPQTATSSILEDKRTDGLELLEVQPFDLDCGLLMGVSSLTRTGGKTRFPSRPRPVSSSANFIKCNLGDLAAGAGVNLTMRFEVSGETGRQVSNTATVSSSLPDPDEGNNASTAITEVVETLSLVPAELQLPPASAQQEYSQEFDALGGVEPISFGLIEDIDGLDWSVDGRTATLSGTPARAGLHSVSVDIEDSLKIPGPQSVSRDYLLQVETVLVINPETLPPATAGVPYSQVVESLNGVPPFAFNFDALPPGLDLVVDTIKGTPQTEGSFPVQISAVDDQGNTGFRAYDFQVNPGGLLEVDQLLPDGVLETAYSIQLFATSGNGPLLWTIPSGLPPGLHLQPTGFIGGLPTLEGSFGFNATVTDALGNSATGQMNININPSGLLARETSFPPGAVGHPYSVPTGFDGGTAPYFCTEGGGGLPPGLFLNGCNIGISGIPTASGTFRFTLEVTDSSPEILNLLFDASIQIVPDLPIPEPDPPEFTPPNPLVIMPLTKYTEGASVPGWIFRGGSDGACLFLWRKHLLAFSGLVT